MSYQELLNKVSYEYTDILKENLVGIYVHGSIAFGCFHWDTSDIDLLVVADKAPTLEEKKKLLTVLLKLDSQCPPKGMEMSIVLRQNCKNFVYPTPFELHFSNAHKESCVTDLEKYCFEMHGVDRDLAAHITVIRKIGIRLCGKNITDVFSEVPRDDYIDSIKGDVADAVNEIDKNPVYIILNLCRVLAYITDGLVLSKEQGGKWGIEHLPETYHTIITNAGNSYCKNQPFAIEKETEHQFANDMLKQIFNGRKGLVYETDTFGGG